MKILLSFLFLLSLNVNAQPKNQGHGRQYRDVFRYLLKQHKSIKRDVVLIDRGVKTYTYSHDSRVAFYIKKHVHQMKGLVESGRRIRNWDPLFSAIFDHYQLIEMNVFVKDKGVEVVETSYDPFVAKLIQEHANVVSLFVRNGPAEAHRSHPVPVR